MAAIVAVLLAVATAVVTTVITDLIELTTVLALSIRRCTWRRNRWSGREIDRYGSIFIEYCIFKELKVWHEAEKKNKNKQKNNQPKKNKNKKLNTGRDLIRCFNGIWNRLNNYRYLFAYFSRGERPCRCTTTQPQPAQSRYQVHNC